MPESFIELGRRSGTSLHEAQRWKERISCRRAERKLSGRMPLVASMRKSFSLGSPTHRSWLRAACTCERDGSIRAICSTEGEYSFSTSSRYSSRSNAPAQRFSWDRNASSRVGRRSGYRSASSSAPARLCMRSVRTLPLRRGALHASASRPTDDAPVPPGPQPAEERPAPGYLEPGEEDLERASQQIGQVARTCVGIGSRCSNGAPQTLIFPPLRISRSGRVKADSSLLFLTCPQLVHFVDLCERDGAIERLQATVNASENLQNRMVAMNRSAARFRAGLLPPEWRQRLCDDSSLSHERWCLFETGLAGVSPNNFTYVKCLHAHLADYLTRGGDYNPLGQFIKEEIAQFGGNLPDLGAKSCEHYCCCASRRSPSRHVTELPQIVARDASCVAH